MQAKVVARFRDERILKGTTVDFPNRDPFFHNVFSLSKAKSFDLGRYTQDDVPSITFDTPGVVQVYCQIHADMNGYILVLDNPFFTVVGADGLFDIDGVPPGDYQLVAWHERATPQRVAVRVTSNTTSHVNIILPADQSSDGG